LIVINVGAPRVLHRWDMDEAPLPVELSPAGMAMLAEGFCPCELNPSSRRPAGGNCATALNHQGHCPDCGCNWEIHG
jgi:hypothetical protein